MIKHYQAHEDNSNRILKIKGGIKKDEFTG